MGQKFRSLLDFYLGFDQWDDIEFSLWFLRVRSVMNLQCLIFTALGVIAAITVVFLMFFNQHSD